MTAMSTCSAVSFDDGAVAWYRNDGSGGFGAQQRIGLLNGPTSVGSGDFDGDGRFGCGGLFVWG